MSSGTTSKPEDIGRFVNLVLNGLALARASGDEMPPADLVLRLLDDAVGGRKDRLR